MSTNIKHTYYHIKHSQGVNQRNHITKKKLLMDILNKQ